MLKTIEINPEASPKSSVIWMHGLGASGHDFVDVIPWLQLPKKLKVRFVLPHAPVRAVKYFGNTKVRAWFNVTDIKQHGDEDEVGIRESEKMISRLIANELALGIPSHKIVLAGFSQGGAMALQCGLRYPKKLAGVLVLSSWLPCMHTVIAERNLINQQTPVLMLHGTEDDLIPIMWAKESCEYLKKIGYNITLLSFPMQHNICPEEMKTIGVWLQEVLQ